MKSLWEEFREWWESLPGATDDQTGRLDLQVLWWDDAVRAMREDLAERARAARWMEEDAGLRAWEEADRTAQTMCELDDGRKPLHVYRAAALGTHAAAWHWEYAGPQLRDRHRRKGNV